MYVCIYINTYITNYIFSVFSLKYGLIVRSTALSLCKPITNEFEITSAANYNPLFAQASFLLMIPYSATLNV